MKFGVGMLNSVQIKAMKLPEWQKSVTHAQQAEALRLADELGYWKISVPEHFVIPREHVELSGEHYPHATTALGYIAGLTKQAKLSSCITILPLLHPIAQAKMWATLDWLSNGRAVMNAAVGWLEEEFELMGVNFHERGRLCDEYIEAIIELWTSDHPTYEGKYVSFRDVGFAPKPVQKPMPIWFGGDAPAVQRRIARFGAGWQPFLTPPDKLPESMDYIRSQKDYHGGPIELSYSITTLRLGHGHVPRDATRAEGEWTNAAEVIDLVGQLKELGVTETSIPPPTLVDFEAYLDWLRWGAEEVMRKV